MRLGEGVERGVLQGQFAGLGRVLQNTLGEQRRVFRWIAFLCDDHHVHILAQVQSRQPPDVYRLAVFRQERRCVRGNVVRVHHPAYKPARLHPFPGMFQHRQFAPFVVGVAHFPGVGGVNPQRAEAAQRCPQGIQVTLHRLDRAEPRLAFRRAFGVEFVGVRRQTPGFCQVLKRTAFTGARVEQSSTIG